MPTLTIEGKRVKVDDAFMQLSPEQQASTVEEIAGQLGISAGGESAGPALEGYVRADGLSKLSGLTQAAAGGGNQDDLIRANMEASKVEKMRGNSAAQDAVIDPLMGWSDELYSATLGNAARMVKDGVGPIEGFKREQLLQQELERRRRERSPVASTVGDIAGMGMTGGAAAKKGLSLIGRTANSGLAARALATSGEGLAYGGIAGSGNAEMGDKVSGGVTGALIGAGSGLALPVLGAGVRAAGRGIAASARPFLAANKAADRTVAGAFIADQGAEALNRTAAATAVRNGQPVMNVDRGGESVRSLARAAANSSPEARGKFDRFIGDRFSGQGTRAVNFLRKIVGTNADDVALRDSVEQAARVRNKANYDKAYAFNFGNNHPVELDEFAKSIPADAVRNAQRIAQLERRPFGEQLIASIDDASGTVRLSRQPSMREWDYIQRGLRSSQESAFRGGNGDVGTAYKNFRNDLLKVLDSANPAFKNARANAAAAFGAEDAIDAGRKFATTTRNTPEMAKALKMMPKTEKDAFAAAYVSGLTRKIESSNDRVNVIRNLFGSEEARKKNIMALGVKGAAELEAFVRIETALDQLRGAMGNSTTARQLKEMIGIGGISGAYGLGTGDWQTAALGVSAAVGRFGAQKASEKASAKMMARIADLLLSQDPKMIERVVKNATVSPKYAAALRSVTDNLMRISPPSAANVYSQVGAQ